MPFGMAKGRLGRIRQPWYARPVECDRLPHAPYTRPKIQPQLYFTYSDVQYSISSSSSKKQYCCPMEAKPRLKQFEKLLKFSHIYIVSAICRTVLRSQSILEWLRLIKEFDSGSSSSSGSSPDPFPHILKKNNFHGFLIFSCFIRIL
jgi:hypothetical protein